MHNIERIKNMNDAELKEASAELEREIGAYVLKQATIRIATVLVVRWAIRRYL